MKAVVLCAGEGTRMKPFTFSKPKQMLPIANKPVIHFALENLKMMGIEDVGIVVNGKNLEYFMRELGNGEKFGLNLSYIVQEEPLGLAHAVKSAEDFVKKEEFVLYLGDNLIKTDLGKLIEKFERERPSSLILVDRVDDPSRFGVVVMDEKNEKVVKLVEKPKEFISDLAIIGMYIFDERIFDAIERIRPSARGEYEITDAIGKLIEMDLKVGIVKLDGWWMDIGSPGDLLKANERILKENEKKFKVRASVVKTRTFGEIDVPENSHIEGSILEGPVVVGENVRIVGSKVGPNVSLGDGVNVEGSVLENSIVMRDSRIENTILMNSVIGEKVSIVGNGEKVKILVGDCGKLEIFE